MERNSHLTVTCAFLIFLVSTILLYAQAPFFFHEIQSADTVYHAAKIARVLEGSPFTDPFSGTDTIYPPFFHFAGATLAKIMHMTPDETIHAMGILAYILLSGSLFFLGYAVFQNAVKACVFYLLFSLIAYAPATKYFLLQGPATFSHPFVFCGMGAMFMYAHIKKINWLLLSAFLLAAACQIWWFNLFFSLPFFIFSLMLYSVPKKEIALSALFFGIPFLFTGFHLYAIQETLVSYRGGSIEKKGSLLSFITTFFMRGQSDYLETLPPWKWHYDPETSLMKTTRDIVNFIFFFALSIPAALFIFFASCTLFFTKKDLPLFTRSLFVLFMAAFFVSALLQIFGNSAHLYRVQLYSHTLLLLFLCMSINIWKRSVPLILAIGGFFTVWHVLHNPLTISKTDFSSVENKELAHVIETIPNSSSTRFFFTDSSYRKLISLAPFYSLVGNRHGRYYFQDPKSADLMEKAYLNIYQLSDWKKALQDFDIKYLGFNKDDPAERILLEHYLKEGEILFENGKWTLLKSH